MNAKIPTTIPATAPPLIRFCFDVVMLVCVSAAVCEKIIARFGFVHPLAGDVTLAPPREEPPIAATTSAGMV